MINSMFGQHPMLYGGYSIHATPNYPIYKYFLVKSKSKKGARRVRNLQVRKFHHWGNLLEYGEVIKDEIRKCMYMSDKTLSVLQKHLDTEKEAVDNRRSL